MADKMNIIFFKFWDDFRTKNTAKFFLLQFHLLLDFFQHFVRFGDELFSQRFFNRFYLPNITYTNFKEFI